jgi:hypothetical protein
MVSPTSTPAWVSLHDLRLVYTPPDGYVFEKLMAGDIPALVDALTAWYPNIKGGSISRYLDPRFYEQQVSLEGGPQRSTIVYVGKTGGKIVCMASLRCDASAQTLFGEFGAIDPAHRSRGLVAFSGAVMLAQAVALEAAVIFSFVTLQTAGLQYSLEKAGFHPVGILPCSDREWQPDGEARHVSEVLYARVMARPSQIIEPDEAFMTSSVRALWQTIREGAARIEAAKTASPPT